jgi:hypothetical protein
LTAKRIERSAESYGATAAEPTAAVAPQIASGTITVPPDPVDRDQPPDALYVAVAGRGVSMVGLQSPATSSKGGDVGRRAWDSGLLPLFFSVVVVAGGFGRCLVGELAWGRRTQTAVPVSQLLYLRAEFLSASALRIVFAGFAHSSTLSRERSDLLAQ